MEKLYVKFTKSAQQKVMELTNKTYLNLNIFKTVQPALVSKTSGRNEASTYIYLNYAENDDLTLSFFIELLHNEAVCIAVQRFGSSSLKNTKLNVATTIQFVDQRNHVLSSQLTQQIKQLKSSQEHSRNMNSRMEQWQHFLKYDFEKAKKDMIKIDIKLHKKIDKDFCFVHISSDVKKNFINWSIYEMAHDVSTYNDFQTSQRRRIGSIIEKEKGSVYKIQLSSKLSSEKKYYAINDGKIIQLERQLNAMKDLTLGRVANNEVENWIFGEPVNLTANAIDLPRAHLFNTDLNKWQYEAVKGALAANDLYCIQGPPGTGKTTVITEICFQNTKNGLKTLIASQSNLAVDNVLAKLMADSDILMLRKGDPDRVEEEGMPFIEKNVIYNWQKNIIELSTNNLNRLQQDISSYEPKNFDEFNIEQQRLREQLNLQQDIINNLEEKENSLQTELTYQEELINNIMQQYKDVIEEAKKLQHYTQIEATKKKIEACCKQIVALTNSDKQLDQTLANESRTLTSLQSIEGISKIYYQKKDLHDKLTEEISKLETVKIQQEKYFNELKQEIEFAETLHTKYPTTLLSDLMYYTEKYSIPFDLTEFTNEANKLLKIDEQLYELNKMITQYETLENDANQLFIQRQINIMQTNITTLLPHQFEEASTLLLNRLHSQPKQLGGGRTQYILTEEWFNALCQDYTNFRACGQQLYSNLQQLTATRETFNTETSLWTLLKKYQANLLEIMQEERITLSRMFKHVKKYENLQQSIENAKVAMEDISKDYVELSLIPSLEMYYEKIALQQSKVEHIKKKKELLKLEQKNLEQNLLNEQSALEYFSTEKQQLRDHLLAKIQFLENQSRLIHRKKKQIIGEQRLVIFEKEQPLKETYALKEQLHTSKQTYLKALENEQKQQAILEEKALLIEFQQEWIQEIKQLKGAKLDELASIYIDHANVIGTTCIQSGSKNFKEAFKEFDVVIIDEVSKATPPEILLPVLKGKKVILVGDHKQLPPMIEESLLNELVEQDEYAQIDKLDLKTYYKESLFERLFTQLTTQFKMTLYTQYRMHPQMMDLIQQFYTDQQHALECGLHDPDQQRAHNLPLTNVQTNDHVIWLDVPNTPDFYEQYVNKTYQNNAEIQLIQQTVIEIIHTIQQQKNDGILAVDYKKDIGIISFYSGQVEAIKMMLEKLNDEQHIYDHADLRVGTVDRFQGMEKEVIIISFVRNNAQNQIGFAKDPRRVNVALSRAQQLLVIIGSTNNFGKKMPIYRNIIEQLKKDNRVINTMEMV
ncbi:AAA domain-containing protein [Caryophanon latum]|uniref:DNA helicase n=1 Tax=Caryophanon latum TaxID=33977 RepID=A0A1C0YUV7_9BACL|nr:AAA domain-containing protein [Caryophanon latum]OCS90967.1 hypothetical protein A6K76_10365 [Caryophanon latum]